MVAVSETHLDRKDSLELLTGFIKKGRWWAIASCGYDKHGNNGRSATVAIAVNEGVDAMFPGTDNEGLTANPRQTSVILKGDAQVVNMTAYGQGGGGLKGANLDLLMDIHRITYGGRGFVIAAGDYNVKAGLMESSGMLQSW